MSDTDLKSDGPPWEDDALEGGGPEVEVEERDPNTDDMFGAPAEAAAEGSIEASAMRPAAPAPPTDDVAATDEAITPRL